MDKDRFNTLLADLDKITDTDIKSLNQLRKKHPYFQSQYVMIARALKTRNHPKTDAFIKKAAIYSADRALLKSIIMDEHSFATAEATVVDTPPTAPAITEEVKAQSPEEVVENEATETIAEERESPVESAIPQAVVEKTENPESVTEAVEETEPTEVVDSATEEVAATTEKNEENAQKETVVSTPIEDIAETVPQEAQTTETTEIQAAESETPTVTETSDNTETDRDVLGDLEKDLLEIRKKKQLIAKMLEQQEAKQSAKKPKESKKKGPSAKTSQSELIEKFIRNEPQMGKQKLQEPESEHGQKDLAARFTQESEAFHTETMAKLMVGQKKYKKAIHIYEKLRLKFPEKSAFFASQIEKLKEKSNG